MFIKFKTKVVKRKQVVKRLLFYYEQATATELTYNWYLEGNQFCRELSTAFKTPLFQVAGIVSAMSPQKNWQENKKLAYQFMKGKRSGQTKQQILKAEKCLICDNETEIFSLLTKKGLKTSYFYTNLLHPDFDSGVTIDRHAIGASLNELKDINTNMKAAVLTKPQYDFFASCFNDVAKVKKVLPLQVQATVWQSYRRLKGLVESYNTNEDIPF